MTININNVLVAFPAAAPQSETPDHAFSCILVQNYDLSGAAPDLTHLSLQFISDLPIFPFLLYPVVQST